MRNMKLLIDANVILHGRDVRRTMNKAVFLDRDGTINRDLGYVYKPADFIVLPGVMEGLRLLEAAGYLLIVITNQSGIARGYYTEEEYDMLEKYIDKLFLANGVHIAKTYHCPHLGEECDCRKPKTGLFYLAAEEFDIDFSKSYAIGDKPRDLCICGEQPVEGILLSPEGRFPGLLEAAEYICAGNCKTHGRKG